jgi:tRNA 2-selenouridine synthase SelU
MAWVFFHVDAEPLIDFRGHLSFSSQHAFEICRLHAKNECEISLLVASLDGSSDDLADALLFSR